MGLFFFFYCIWKDMTIKGVQEPQEVSSTFQFQAWWRSGLWQGKFNSYCWCEALTGPTCLFPRFLLPRDRGDWLLLEGSRHLQRWRPSIGSSLCPPLDIWSLHEAVKIWYEFFFSWNAFFFKLELHRAGSSHLARSCPTLWKWQVPKLYWVQLSFVHFDSAHLI